ncbi:MAG TPA: sugar phosphate nucleotidyltransferase, partial [Pirellulales bacterium]
LGEGRVRVQETTQHPHPNPLPKGEGEFKNLWILTGAVIADAVRQQLPQVPPAQILGEPCKRDTAPCIGLAALLLMQADPNAVMAVMPADQVISPDDKFQRSVELAAALVEEQPERIVTFGIKPTYPATTFGYIERGEPMAIDSQRKNLPLPRGEGTSVFQVKCFREKPPAEIAKQYLASGNYYWNSGIFIWKAATIVAALDERQPEMMQHLRTIVAAWNQPNFQTVFANEFAAIKGISIDYAVMEHAKEIAVAEWPHTWSDVGTWQAAAQLAEPDAEGNTIVGRHLGIDTRNSIIRAGENHLVTTVGVHDLIIVHTPDATLVANRYDEESLRRIVKLLEERGWTEYL